MQEKLKAFIVTYELMGVKEAKSVAIISYSKKEAGDLFIRWAKAKNIYTNIVAICVQRTKKTKRNKAWFTPTYYKRQCDAVKALERKADA